VTGGHGGRASGGLDRRGAGGLSPGRRQGTGVGTVECRGRRVSLVRHGELLEEKLIPHRMEGGERHSPLDESLQVTVAGLRPRGRFSTKVRSATGSARSRRESARPFICRQYSPTSRSPLVELVELGVEVKSSSVPVPEELFLEGEPRLTARVRLVADDVLELDGDSSVEPGEHHGVHQGPGRGRRGGNVVKDVVVEGVAPQGEEDLPSLARVV
jgi:hypothetical protein